MRARLTLSVPRAGFAAVVVSCFAVPVIFSRRAAEVYMVPKATIAWVCLVLAWVGLAVWAAAARANPVPATKVGLPLLVLTALTAVATVWSTSPVISFFGQYGRYDGFLGLVTCAGLATATVAYCWRDPTRLRWIAYAIVAGGAVDLGYVCIQRMGWDWVRWTDESGLPLPWPYGLLGNSDFSGAHLAIALPLAIALAIGATDRRAKAGLIALAAAFPVGIWFMSNRGGTLAVAGGLAALAVLLPSVVPRFAARVAIGLTLAGVGIVLIAATTQSVPGSEAFGPTRFLSTRTLQSRIDIWKTSSHIAADHPLVGVGPDALALHYPYHRAATAPGTVALNADEAHDIYLDRATTAGFPALAAYLWLVGAVAVGAWRRRLTVPVEHRLLLGGFGGAFGAYLVQGTVSIDVIPVALLGWICMGALVSLADPRIIARRDADEGALGRDLRPLSTLALVAGGVALVAVLAVSVRPLMADVRYRNGIRATQDGRPLASGARDFADAIDWFPAEPRYHSRRADQLVLMATREAKDDATRTHLLEEAVDGYDAALHRAPGEVSILRSKARAEVALAATDGYAHLDEAEADYRRLTRLVPTDASLPSELAGVLVLQAGRTHGARAAALRREATREAERSVAVYSGSADTRAQLATYYVAAGRLHDARAQLRAAIKLQPTRRDLRRSLARVDRALTR